MNELSVIVQNGVRVLTSSQLAESYGTTTDKISYNFNYNEKRYKLGKHFFLLTGEDLKIFKETNREFQGSINKLYLWTVKGAWLHAKSLNTDEAWEAYEALVDDYYDVKQPNLFGLSPQLQYLIQLEQKQNEMEKKINQIADGLTATPDPSKVKDRINEYVRYTRQDYDEVYNGIYQILKAQHGIDIKARVENERRNINAERLRKTGKVYAESTLKQKVNGIDVMVRMGVLDKFNNILVGLLAKAKGIE